MGTTANYSWPTPVATDLVKDGWEAIKDLGDAADTTVKAVSDAQGLVHINTTTFSAVSAQSINDVFSADYDSYRIVLEGLTASGTQGINMRLRVGGSDDSTANSYVYQTLNANDTGIAGARVTGTVWDLSAFVDTLVSIIYLDITNPFKTSATGFFSNTERSTSGAYIGIRSGTHNQNTSYTGFTFYPSTSTITGSVSVYGYRKS